MGAGRTADLPAAAQFSGTGLPRVSPPVSRGRVSRVSLVSLDLARVSLVSLDLARVGRRIYLAGRPVGELPFRMEGWLGRKVIGHLVLGLAFNHVLTVKTPPGRAMRHAVLTRGGPLIRVRSADLARQGVERTGRVVGAQAGRPLLSDGRALEVGNVIWCTGFHGGYDWIDLPAFDERGEPRHQRGAVTGQPGLYFVGLHFLYAMSSGMIQGVGRDARHVVDRIAGQGRAATAG